MWTVPALGVWMTGPSGWMIQGSIQAEAGARPDHPPAVHRATPTRAGAIHHRQAVVHGRRTHAGTGPSTASTA